MKSLKISHDEWEKRYIHYINKSEEDFKVRIKDKADKNFKQFLLGFLFIVLFYIVVFFLFMWGTEPEQWYAGSPDYNKIIKKANK